MLFSSPFTEEQVIYKKWSGSSLNSGCRSQRKFRISIKLRSVMVCLTSFPLRFSCFYRTFTSDHQEPFCLQFRLRWRDDGVKGFDVQVHKKKQKKKHRKCQRTSTCLTYVSVHPPVQWHFTESESSSVFFTCPRSKRTSIQSLIFPLSMSFSLKTLSPDDICRCPKTEKYTRTDTTQWGTTHTIRNINTRKLGLKWLVSPGGSWQPYYAHRDQWTEQKTKTTTPKSEESRACAPFDCLRPSKAKGGWYCRPVPLSHCYWWVWSPRSHRRQKWQGDWF